MALSATPIREALVTDRGPWREVECHDEIDSTNATSLADPRPWRVVTCRHQRAGRGRHARPWASPPGGSVAVSLTVPMPADADRWGWLPLLTGLAVVDALAGLTGASERFALKWPNDVLVAETDGAWGKACGILCELAPTPDGPLVVAGIGVNVALRREELPVPHATSLTLAGFARPDEAELVVALAEAFAGWHAGWYGGSLAQLAAAYRDRCDTLGREVEMYLPDGSTVRGVAQDIAPGGDLVLALADPDAPSGQATRRAFAAGDVVHVRPRPDPLRYAPGAAAPRGRA